MSLSPPSPYEQLTCPPADNRTCHLEVKSAAEKKTITMPLLENHAGPLQQNYQLVNTFLSVSVNNNVKLHKNLQRRSCISRALFQESLYINKYSNPDFHKNPTNGIKLEIF